MTKIFFTSDLHFQHTNIQKFCPESRGGFASIQHMNEALVSRFNERVSDADHTFILGDLVFGQLSSGIEYLKRLNGTKTLITGNHDRKLIKDPSFKANLDSMKIEEIVSEKFLTIEGVYLHLYHFPIAEWDQCHRGSYHLHGHQHSPKNQLITHRKMDVGVDSNDLYPYSWDEIHRILKNKPIYGHHV